jgi:anti-sigma regulatory factor (Ser/Thr protein kinase)
MRRRALSIGATLDGPARARAAVAEAFAVWRLPEQAADEPQVCVSELVANAVVHAKSTVDVTLQLEGDRLLVLVADAAFEDAAELRTGDPEAAGRRGSPWSTPSATPGASSPRPRAPLSGAS